MYYLYAVVPLAPLVYLFLKWRAYRDDTAADPWLGAAVLLQYFWTLALHLVLFGLVLAVAGLIGDKMDGEVRPGLALLFTGVVALLAAFFALKLLPAIPSQGTGLAGVLRPQPAGLRPAGAGRPRRRLLRAVYWQGGRRPPAARRPGRIRRGRGLVPAAAHGANKAFSEGDEKGNFGRAGK